ncbi:hypothetical protein [Brachybacterium sacelli]|uniref:hypothetical protein n=1 Tax=Brachybacterium sacelli TaxID=173364 RepID=UPI00361AB61F
METERCMNSRIPNVHRGTDKRTSSFTECGWKRCVEERFLVRSPAGKLSVGRRRGREHRRAAGAARARAARAAGARASECSTGTAQAQARAPERRAGTRARRPPRAEVHNGLHDEPR